jgi:hypothetical protein
MFSPNDQIGAQPHTPDVYRKLVSESGIISAAALTIAPADDLRRTRARNDAVLELAHGSGGFFFPVCSVHPADGTNLSWQRSCTITQPCCSGSDPRQGTARTPCEDPRPGASPLPSRLHTPQLAG